MKANQSAPGVLGHRAWRFFLHRMGPIVKYAADVQQMAYGYLCDFAARALLPGAPRISVRYG